MKLEVVMCHSSLMSMLLRPEEFEQAVHSYSATSPDVQHEGFVGYMETKVTFQIKDLERFSKLYSSSYTYPSDRSAWYDKVKRGLLECTK